MITAKDILGFDDGEVKSLIVPQWKDQKDGGQVYIRSLDYGEVTAFRAVCNNAGMAGLLGLGDDTAMQKAKDSLLIQSLCDSKGVRLFEDDEDDLEKVRKIQGQTEAFLFIFEQAIQFNKILKKDQDDLDKPFTAEDDVEDLKKKLST